MNPWIFCFAIGCFSLIHAQDLPEEALQRLLEGNKRFVAGPSHCTHKDLAQEAAALKQGQEPCAAIIGCSDSRVPPEIIFDQGPGDLFIVRDAGNVIGPIELDSVQYAIQRLHVPLVLVLGHENCGAVTATLLGQAHAPELTHVYALIAPALKKCKALKGDLLINAIRCNVEEGVEYLKSQPDIAQRVKENRLKIVGGYYDFDHGTVTLIPLREDPSQKTPGPQERRSSSP